MRPRDLSEFALVDGEFMECELCAAQRGSPTLCGACLNNRTVMARLEKANRNLRQLVEAVEVERAALEAAMVDRS